MSDWIKTSERPFTEEDLPVLGWDGELQERCWVSYLSVRADHLDTVLCEYEKSRYQPRLRERITHWQPLPPKPDTE